MLHVAFIFLLAGACCHCHWLLPFETRADSRLDPAAAADGSRRAEPNSWPVCAKWSSFSAPQRLAEPNDPYEYEWSPTLTDDGLQMFFQGMRVDPSFDIFLAQRTLAGAPFAGPVRVAELSTPVDEKVPGVSADGTQIAFVRIESGGRHQLWLATRSTATGQFTALRPLAEISSGVYDWAPRFSPDKRRLYWAALRPGGKGQLDIWTATRPDPSSPFGPPEPVVELNTSAEEFPGDLSADGREFFFTSGRPGGLGGYDVWVARRSGPGVPWGLPENVTELNTTSDDCYPDLSRDGRTLYLNRDATHAGGDQGKQADIWVATRNCLEPAP